MNLRTQSTQACFLMDKLMYFCTSKVYGLAYFERRRGCFKHELFQDLFSRALYYLRDTLNISLGNFVIVIENAPCHTQIEAALHRNLDFIGVQILRMSPYSAPLSPIKLLWNNFKAAAKRKLQGSVQQLIQTPSNGMTQSENRLVLLSPF